jgi:ABC-2 type transport system permease protein
MRLWSEERKSGTIELLMTLPISPVALVLGKFFAAWAFTCSALALTFPFWITVNLLGTPDNGVIIGGYLACFIVSGSLVAIGSFFSCLTKNQITAFITTTSVCFVLIVSGSRGVLSAFADWAPEFLYRFIAELSILDHFLDMQRGLFSLSGLVYFFSLTAIFLFLTIWSLDKVKAR